MQSTTFQIVVAVDKNNGIGREGRLPWTLPADLSYFRELTSKTRDNSRLNAVIMGRKTWDSIPEKHRPLKGRLNIVLSRSSSLDQNKENDVRIANGAASLTKEFEFPPGVLVASSLESAMDIVSSKSTQLESVFVIGGGQVYAEALAHPACYGVHLTRIDKDYDCDTFFPALDTKTFRVWSASQPMRDAGGTSFSFLCYTRGDTPEGSVSSPQQQQQQLPPAMSSRHDEMQVCLTFHSDSLPSFDSLEYFNPFLLSTSTSWTGSSRVESTAPTGPALGPTPSLAAPCATTSGTHSPC